MTQIKRSTLTRKGIYPSVRLFLTLLLVGLTFFTFTTLYHLSQISKHDIYEFKKRKQKLDHPILMDSKLESVANRPEVIQNAVNPLKSLVSDSSTSTSDNSQYWTVRSKMDILFPFDSEEDQQRVLRYVESIRKPSFRVKEDIIQDMPYDIYNCPDEPPVDYPIEWQLVTVLTNWNPNDTTKRTGIYQGLCQFDYATEFSKAERYRKAEKPFIIRNDPQVLRVAERWNQPGYLSAVFGKDQYHTEYSSSNHLMYYKTPGKRKNLRDWVPPITNIKMTYDDWVVKASQPLEDMGPNKPHWYFRANVKDDSSQSIFILDELPFFKPERNFYIVDERDTRGINCRFGMNGNIAEAHFDGSRNFVMLFGGERRYILSHPRNCEKLGLYEPGHPSARHSALDWSNPNLQQFPEFADAFANEIVLQAGDVLYLPTFWFHFIISLDLNWQCNARSGVTRHYSEYITKCGF